MKTALALAFVLFNATPAAAQSMLLAEITQSGYDADGVCNNCSNFWVGLKFATYALPIDAIIIDGPFYASDVGRVIHAPPDLVHRFRNTMGERLSPINPDPSLLSVALDNFTSIKPDDLFWNFPPNEHTQVTMHVPRRGYGLIGYSISEITTTIEQAEYGDGYAAARYTVRLYGEQIPEPASWLLTCLALCLLHRRPYRVPLS
jgi:hypothetical protein